MEGIIGIIGGVGPYAGLDFLRNICNNTRAVKDQDHINSLLVSCPSLIPDRTAFLLGDEKDNPAYGMVTCAKMLYDAGARYVSVACNTAHAGRIFTPFCTMVERFEGLTIVNMLETCVVYVKTRLQVHRIGLLATKGTYTSGVYHEYFREEEGFTLMEPAAAEQEAIHAAIYNETFGIKAHSAPVTVQAKIILQEAITALAGRGAEAVILGCTELPLAVSPSKGGLPLLDPGLLTARRLIELIAPEKLSPAVRCRTEPAFRS
ncbi:MAG: amino acid racemase [Treponema sp.]|nr:amino acid racemase [Treponema sp.]